MVFRLKLVSPGRHSVSNVLAGLAVAGIFGITPADLTETIAGLRPSGMRGERFVDEFDDDFER